VPEVPGSGSTYTAIAPDWGAIPRTVGNTYYQALNAAVNSSGITAQTAFDERGHHASRATAAGTPPVNCDSPRTPRQPPATPHSGLLKASFLQGRPLTRPRSRDGLLSPSHTLPAAGHDKRAVGAETLRGRLPAVSLPSCVPSDAGRRARP